MPNKPSLKDPPLTVREYNVFELLVLYCLIMLYLEPSLESNHPLPTRECEGWGFFSLYPR